MWSLNQVRRSGLQTPWLCVPSEDFSRVSVPVANDSTPRWVVQCCALIVPVREASWRHLGVKVFTTLMKLWESKDDGNYRSGGFPRMVGFPNNYWVFLLKMTILVHFGVFWGYHHFRKHPYKYCISCLFHVQKTICQKHLNRKFGRMLDRCTTKVIQK